MTDSAIPANTSQASDQQVVEAIEGSSKKIVVTIKKIDEEDRALDQLGQTGQELKLLMKDAYEIYQHVKDAEKHHHIDHGLVEGCMKDEEEMKGLVEDLENRGFKYAMALESNTRTLIKYTQELERRLN